MPSFRFLKVGILLLQASVAWAQNDDLFEFFAAEAQVITASRRPQAILQAPATVYVVTAEDIEASGAHNLWDALRSVPGVDVMSSRTSYGEVSIRGLNKAFNNRTLVLVDGRSVLNGDQDRINWTSLPVLLEEIERIEVVEGPASALYGANAISGVINIITKTPQQTQGAQLNYTVGERRTHLGSLLYSGRQQKLDYRLGLGWRTTNRFENDALRASEVMVLHGLLGYELSSGARLNLSGGGTRAETNASLGALSEGIEDADRGFVRADYVRRDTRLRFFWEGESGHLESLAIPQDPSVDYDFYDLNLEHTLVHAPRHNLVVGGGYRQADFQSDVITSGRVQHNLWALFFENEWRPADSWALWASGRLDQHPHTDLVFSPRFSAIFIPVPEHALRFSTGTSFRNPTLIENHVDFVEPVEVPELDLVLDFEFLGNTAMEPERLLFFEVAHSAQMGRIKTTAAGFHYRLKDGISSSASGIDVVDSAKIAVTTSFQNRGETRAWGGELGAEFLLGDRLRGFANYSHQRLSGELDGQVAAGGRPHHKVNGGLRFSKGRLQLSASVHWVDRTLWNNNGVSGGPTNQLIFREVDSYTLVNCHLGYRFSGRWQKVKLNLDAFNLLDNEHFETLPGQNLLAPGQAGEIIRARRTLGLEYQF